MGIFRPTKISGDIVIYSKWCVSCEYPRDLQIIQSWAQQNDLELQIVRTAYRPADHAEAMQLWAKREDAPANETEDELACYPIFVVYQGIKTLRKFVKMITDAKNKLVPEGETKDDVQRLPKTKRSKRKSSGVRAISKTKTPDEEKE